MAEHAIQGPRTEAEIERQVLDYLTRPDVLSALERRQFDDGGRRTAMAEDEEQLRDLAMWAEKAITLDEYAEARKIIESRMDQARRRP